MNYSQPELRERLAAEYALGTLRGPARRRFERLMQGDAALRQIVRDWEMRVNLLAESAPAVSPPAHLWPAIERRLVGVATAAAKPLSARVRWWELIGFWRPFGFAAAAAAIALALFSALRPAGPTPEQIAALDHRLAGIEGKLAAIEPTPERIGEVNDRLSGIEGKLAQLDSAAGRIGEVSDRLARIESGTADLAKTPATIAELAERLRGIEGKLAQVESTPGQIGAVNDRLARIESSTSELAGTPAAFAELAQRLAQIENRIAVSERAISHVAVLLDKDGRPMMDANLDLVDGRLVLRLNIKVPRSTAGKSLEVWLVPPGQDAAPHSLGLFPSDEHGTSIVLPLTPETARALSTSSLAVSLEPAGGSTTGLPTGPVLFSGAVVPVNL